MLLWFAETALVASVLAAVAALAPRLRVLGPAARHALWLVVLVKLVTPPLVRSPWPVAAPSALAFGAGTHVPADLSATTAPGDATPVGDGYASETPAAASMIEGWAGALYAI